MSDEKTCALVPSTNWGRYALHDPQGYDLTSGQPLAVLLGGQPVRKRVRAAQAERGYYFIATGGTICGLCAGMQVRQC